MLQAECTEVAPGLRLYELNIAIRHVHKASNNNGFMMAWQSINYPYPMGFCYIVSANNYLVTIRARTPSYEDRLSYITAHHLGCSNGRDSFVEEFLRVSAEDMSGNYAETVNHLAKDSSLWRFESFVDGKSNNDWRDNGIAWRALWGRIIEADGKPVADVPPDVRESVQVRLKSFAVEGQIILNR